MVKKRNKYKWTYDRSAKRSLPSHRILLERVLGRKLKSDEVVHHINQDPIDNRLENLQLLSASEHLAIHIPAKYPEIKICASCGKSFRPNNTKRKRSVTCGSKECIDKIIVLRNKNRKVTPQIKSQIESLKQSGKTLSQIGIVMSLSRITVFRSLHNKIKGANQ